jgi:hypothetical protein
VSRRPNGRRRNLIKRESDDGERYGTWGNHAKITLTYDRDANALLALDVAAAITSGLADNTIVAFDNKSGTPPVLPPNTTGEFVQSQSGTTLLPKSYDDVVDAAKTAVIFGNGDKNEQVLAGDGKLTFFATGGSGAIITGGGAENRPR